METGPFRALSFTFRVRCTDASVGRYLARVFADLADDDCEAAHVYSFVDGGPSSVERYKAWFDDERIVATAFPHSALGGVLWHVNRRTIATCDDHVLVHAAGVEHDGAGVILPAPMESGKTTLTAGLLSRTDVRYLTDEAVAVDPATGLLSAFPKALTIDEGSWPVVPELEPTVDPAVLPFLRRQWHVPAGSIRAGAVAETARPALVVAPRYDPAATTRLEPLRRSAALVLLVENSFNLSALGAAGFDALAELVRSCECYRMPVSNLDEATRLVASLLGAGTRMVDAR